MANREENGLEYAERIFREADPEILDSKWGKTLLRIVASAWEDGHNQGYEDYY